MLKTEAPQVVSGVPYYTSALHIAGGLTEDAWDRYTIFVAGEWLSWRILDRLRGHVFLLVADSGVPRVCHAAAGRAMHP